MIYYKERLINQNKVLNLQNYEKNRNKNRQCVLREIG